MDGNLEEVEFFVQEYYDAFVKEQSGKPFIQLAHQTGYVVEIQYLLKLQFSGEIMIKDDFNNTPIHLCCFFLENTKLLNTL